MPGLDYLVDMYITCAMRNEHDVKVWLAVQVTPQSMAE